jgi:hypothetical protein
LGLFDIRNDILSLFACRRYFSEDLSQNKKLNSSIFNFVILGDLEWLHRNIKSLGIYLLLSGSIFFVGLVLCFVNVAVQKTKFNVIFTIIYIICVSVVLLQDTGTTLRHHGQYNLLALSFLFVPLLFIFVVVWTLIYFCGSKRTLIVGLLLLFTTIFSILWKIDREKANWSKGLMNEYLIYEWSNCSIPKNFIPWAAIIPMQFIVFLRGRLICSPPFEPFSWVDSNNILTVSCPSTAFVIEGPDFLKERESHKELNEQDQLSLYNRTRTLSEIRYNYTRPTKLQREFVQVFCNNKENFHLRNVMNLTKYLSDLTHNTSNEIVRGHINHDTRSPPLNIFLIVIDALSRAHSLRKLPKTLQVLEYLHKSGKYTLFQYFRYHTLGVHSEPNVLPIYSGTEGENYNGYPLFFEYFNREKYLHLWLHGSCQDFFQGYLDDRLPSCLDYEVILPFCHPSYHPLGKHPTGNFQGPYSLVARCIAGRMVHTYMLDYLRSFFQNHRHLPLGKIITSIWLEAHEGCVNLSLEFLNFSILL